MKRIIKSQDWQNVQWLVETPLHEETHSSQLCHLANNHMHKLIFFWWFFGIPTSVKHGYYCLYLFFKTQIKQTSNTLLSQRGWTSILTHQMVWVGVWHCQVSPKLQINTSFTSFTSPAWHYIFGRGIPTKTFTSQCCSSEIKPSQGATSAMVLSKPWTAPHLAGCALGALLLKSLVPPRICQKINSSTEGQNFTEQHLTQLHHTTHTYTHQSRRYMRGGCINKKTQKNSNQAIL